MAGAFALFLIEEAAYELSIPRRTLKDTSDPFQMEDDEFLGYFQINKELAHYLINNLAEELPSERLKPSTRVLIALRFYVTGNHQGSVGNDLHLLPVSQATVSRSIQLVTDAIIKVLKTKIQFPKLSEQESIKERFCSKYGLPGVIGCIDCTHVGILKPYQQTSEIMDVDYMNGKGYYSINVQMVVDDNLLIRYVNARYPGCVHDAFIWHHCQLRTQLQNWYENGNQEAWLLGDSDYDIEPWLMTPFDHPDPGSVEEHYNIKHMAARSCIERCFKALKSRFRCLSRHRVLNYNPTRAAHIVYACSILHNLCIQYGLKTDEVEDVDDIVPLSDKPPLELNQDLIVDGERRRFLITHLL